MYHRTVGFTGHEREVYKSLVSRLINEGCVIDSTFLDDQPNLRPTFAAIGFDCLLDINKKNCPIFVLQFYQSVRLIRKLNGTLAIAFKEFIADMTFPCEMLLTQLFEHVHVNHPYSFSNELYLVDHVMIPLSEKRVFRFKHKGKRPRLPTPTPSNSE
ncbi:hypothetical protein Tco_0601823 [Tanacetum coccineum]